MSETARLRWKQGESCHVTTSHSVVRKITRKALGHTAGVATCASVRAVWWAAIFTGRVNHFDLIARTCRARYVVVKVIRVVALLLNVALVCVPAVIPLPKSTENVAQSVSRVVHSSLGQTVFLDTRGLWPNDICSYRFLWGCAWVTWCTRQLLPTSSDDIFSMCFDKQ